MLYFGTWAYPNEPKVQHNISKINPSVLKTEN